MGTGRNGSPRGLEWQNSFHIGRPWYLKEAAPMQVDPGSSEGSSGFSGQLSPEAKV